MMRANVNVQGGLRQILQQQQPPQFQQQVMSGGTMMSNMQPNPQQVRASFSSKFTIGSQWPGRQLNLRFSNLSCAPFIGGLSRLEK